MTDHDIQKLITKKELLLVLSNYAFKTGDTKLAQFWKDVGTTATMIGRLKLSVEIEQAEYTESVE